MRVLLGFKKENKKEKERNTLRERMNTTDYEKERGKLISSPWKKWKANPQEALGLPTCTRAFPGRDDLCANLS